MRISGAKALVVGMARSGVAAMELLLREKADVRVADARPLSAIDGLEGKLASLNVPFLPQTPEAFQGVDLIVVSPGVPADLPDLEAARARGVPVIGEVELASFFLRGPILGVTGSNGKTTTTALIGHILKSCGIPCQVGGNIGTPPTALVDASRDEQWNVLELSSFQLETVFRFRARIGVALNVTPNHLNRHHTFENYAAAKSRLFLNQTEEDFAVLNACDDVCRGYSRTGRGRPVWFGLRSQSDGAWFDGEYLVADGTKVLAARDLSIRGLHNVENTLAAIAATRLTGASLEGIAEAARTFQGVEHRLEFVAKVRGVDFYNDSKATSVDATRKALSVFQSGLWVILGGEDKGAPYTVLREELQAKARAVLLIGAATPKIARDLSGSVTLVECGTLERAVEEAFRNASPGDTILLAPACASFDQFRSFEHRGEVFKSLVRKLELQN
ncbi:MAG: UDP-N-acetylmuramoyl-L-alanine--D-glutamate ligase [Bryobacteraceae bacterium]|nr:UDP-N-acetylmuramoyl-L-alanine--D-glutamate ligase [Bryobacteraceae bacterium]